MAEEPDYRAVEVPEQKPPEEYHWTQRRAEILQLVEEAGHPRAINQARLSDRYGVSEAQISKDMKRLRKYITNRIDEQRVDTITQTVFQKAIREMVENGEYMDAVKATEKWNNWLFDRGKVDKEPDKHEVDGDGIVFNLTDPDE